MDFEIKDVDSAKEEVNTKGAWDQFRPILQTLSGLDEDEAIVVEDLTDASVKSLRSFLHYYLPSDEYNMRQSKQLDGTVTAVVETA